MKAGTLILYIFDEIEEEDTEEIEYCDTNDSREASDGAGRGVASDTESFEQEFENSSANEQRQRDEHGDAESDKVSIEEEFGRRSASDQHQRDDHGNGPPGGVESDEQATVPQVEMSIKNIRKRMKTHPNQLTKAILNCTMSMTQYQSVYRMKPSPALNL